jgi:hypothetical protein
MRFDQSSALQYPALITAFDHDAARAKTGYDRFQHTPLVLIVKHPALAAARRSPFRACYPGSPDGCYTSSGFALTEGLSLCIIDLMGNYDVYPQDRNISEMIPKRRCRSGLQR